MNRLFFLCAILAVTAACSSSDNDGDGGGGSEDPGGGGGGCSGDITACSVGSLSDSQRGDMCNLTLAAIDSPQGARYECTSGPQVGAYLEVRSKDKCVSQPAPATCAVKVSQLLDCYKAAKADTCTAFAESGACAVLIQAKGCS